MRVGSHRLKKGRIKGRRVKQQLSPPCFLAEDSMGPAASGSSCHGRQTVPSKSEPKEAFPCLNCFCRNFVIVMIKETNTDFNPNTLLLVLLLHPPSQYHSCGTCSAFLICTYRQLTQLSVLFCFVLFNSV